MATDFALAERVFQSLLDHYWHARDSNTLKEVAQYPKGYAISYKKLIEASGVPLDPRHAGGPLFHIAGYCKSKHWPPIHSLVVRGNEGDPGEGYFRAPGSEIAELSPDQRYAKWSEYVVACANFADYPRKAPPIELT